MDLPQFGYLRGRRTSDHARYFNAILKYSNARPGHMCTDALSPNNTPTENTYAEHRKSWIATSKNSRDRYGIRDYPQTCLEICTSKKLTQCYCVNTIWIDAIDSFTDYYAAKYCYSPSELSYKTPQLSPRQLQISRIKTLEGYILTRSIEHWYRITRIIVPRKLAFTTAKLNLGNTVKHQHAKKKRNIQWFCSTRAVL